MSLQTSRLVLLTRKKPLRHPIWIPCGSNLYGPSHCLELDKASTSTLFCSCKKFRFFVPLSEFDISRIIRLFLFRGSGPRAFWGHRKCHYLQIIQVSAPCCARKASEFRGRQLETGSLKRSLFNSACGFTITTLVPGLLPRMSHTNS